jgi:alpha-mannosidase
LGKLKKFEDTLEARIFQKVAELSMEIVQTDDSHYAPPHHLAYETVEKGTPFVGEGIYAWIKGEYTPSSDLVGKRLYIWPKTIAYEGLLFVDYMPYGNFASKHLLNSHGTHYCKMFAGSAESRPYQIDIEYYANHFIKGTMPLQPEEEQSYEIVYNPSDICTMDELINDCYHNLVIVNQMVEVLDADSYIRAKLVRALLEVHKVVYYDADSVEHEKFYLGVKRANQILKEALRDKNATSQAYVGLVGHSHMDTAWLWHRKETEKKCGRTFANQMSLMDQFSTYTFIQSSAHHGDMIRRLYPSLFEKMKERIAQGRYEPNGAVWIECDCNIPSGEYIIRQFLYGQRFTREHFNYTSDAFWLPDTFGYSAALPQIMRGCGVSYFLTTKIAWNDTNQFPYDSFYWKGIDGTAVLTHFNRTHIWPDPKAMSQYVLKAGPDSVMERSVSNMRLFTYGFGDGGGGPEDSMVEIANRMTDIEGMPRTEHTTVSEFMKGLERELYQPSTYSGELYLELHRGTLTQMHQIKRNNRKAEIAIRDAELFLVLRSLEQNTIACGKEIRPHVEELLINQFHDILPGTAIPRVHIEAMDSVAALISDVKELQKSYLQDMKEPHPNKLTIINSLSFERKDVIYLPYEGKELAEPVKQQVIKKRDGSFSLAVFGLALPALGSKIVQLTQAQEEPKLLSESVSAFKLDDALLALETPYYQVEFNEKGYICSLFDKRVKRQVKGEGYALGTFLIGEDVPMAWDNWDIDADLECKLADTALLQKRELVSKGEVELRIRSVHTIGEKSSITQDMIFYADKETIVFDTVMDWQDDHRFLRVAFDTSIASSYANQEIQFGYLRRETNRNTGIEKAKFEVSNHKYTDISETRYGVAVLNDSKYGISVHEGRMHLSLHKSGTMPDYNGDKGIHDVVYALHPHVGGFSANSVIQGAYSLNIPPVLTEGVLKLESLLQIDASNIIVESIKPLEDAKFGFLIRLYEAEGCYTNTQLDFSRRYLRAAWTNMLEEEVEELIFDPNKALSIETNFTAFEIKSLKLIYHDDEEGGVKT